VFQVIENKRSEHTLLVTPAGGRIGLVTIGYRNGCSPRDYSLVRSAPIRDAIRVYFVADFAYHRPTSHNFLE
jgi:hypothetical protein